VPLPRPTGPQIQYQQDEIMALIHFNMATFARNGDPGCSAGNWAEQAPYAAGLTNDPHTFNPAKVEDDEERDCGTHCESANRQMHESLPD
jgi:hypothetical protein